MANAGKSKANMDVVNRKLKYKQLIEKGTTVSDNLENRDVLETFHTILDIVQTCDGLSSSFVASAKIENANEYLMDAQIIKMSHDLMGNASDKMKANEFCEDEYINALLNMFTLDNAEHNFNEIADIAVKCCKTSQFSTSLLGTFNFDAAPRPEKIAKERQRVTKSIVPTMKALNVTQLKKSHKGAEKINVVRAEIQRVCRERDISCLPYYELICHPSNFMTSIDTAFQISFLVRDGFLGLKSVDNEPFVYPLDSADSTQQHQRTQHPSDTVQCVMSLNTKTWKENIRKYNISEPLLKCGDSNEVEDADTFVDEEMETDSD